MSVLSISGILFLLLVGVLLLIVHKADTPGDAIGYGLFFVIVFGAAVIDAVVFLIALLLKVVPR